MGDANHNPLMAILRVIAQQPDSKTMLPISSLVQLNTNFSREVKRNIAQIHYCSFSLSFNFLIAEFIARLKIEYSRVFLGIEIEYLLIGDTS